MLLSFNVVASNEETYNTVKQNCANLTKNSEPVLFEFCKAFKRIHDNKNDCTKSELFCSLSETNELSVLTNYMSIKTNLIKEFPINKEEVDSTCTLKDGSINNICETKLYLSKAINNCQKSKEECSKYEDHLKKPMIEFIKMQVQWVEADIKALQ